MKYGLIILSLVASALAGLEPTLHNYHVDIGIPLAEKIRLTEENKLNESANVDNRIIGGVIAPLNSHPYLGALLITFWNHPGSSVCGSSLLTVNRAVTAAHCWRHGGLLGREFTVILGSNFLYSGGIRIPTSNVELHPQYHEPTLNNDVAMIYLPINVPLSATIQTIPLASPVPWAETYVGEWALAAGFGAISSESVAQSVMSEVYLQVISNDECRRTYVASSIIDSTLCTSGRTFAGNVGVCPGDSGGPLVAFRNGQRILIGITSFAAPNMCHVGHPSGFARVTSFYSFITSRL